MADFNGAPDGGQDLATDTLWAAAGDIVYATADDVATVLTVGCNNDLLQLAAGVPAWTDSPTIGSTSWENAVHTHTANNSGGAISVNNCNWSGADLSVANGGTGLSCLTTGSILIGTGSSDITLVDMATKGDILIGDGTTAPRVLDLGTNCYVLTVDCTEPTGMKWAAAGGGGKSVGFILALS